MGSPRKEEKNVIEVIEDNENKNLVNSWSSFCEPLDRQFQLLYDSFAEWGVI